MSPNNQQNELNKELAVRFSQLPKPVQDSILSADIQKRLRELVTAHKLHVDQWDSLENEVMLTILGFEQAKSLEQNLIKEVGIEASAAHGLADSINKVVFEPIRRELERQLTHPEAKKEEVSGVEAARTHILGSAQGETAETQSATPPTPALPVVAPATPPTSAPEKTVARAPASGAYKPGEPSTERKTIEDDPYREPPQ